MALPIALGAVLAPMFLALGRVLTGAVVAVGVYQFVSSVALPALQSLVTGALGLSDDFGGWSELMDFFQFSQMISILLSAYVAAFTVKIAIRAIAAYAQRT